MKLVDFDKARIRQGLEQYVLSPYYSIRSNNGIEIMDEDWDTLIVLDACRGDLMQEVAPSDWPTVQTVQSQAGNTYNWYLENFEDGPYLDTVTVTANPRTNLLRGNSFLNIIDVTDQYWNDEKGTVLPTKMAKKTIELHEKYSDKRILSHWIQPHYPFIGNSGDLPERSALEESPWKDIYRGVIKPEKVYKAYKETLRETIEHVNRVLRETTGKVVVTSDHGNLFGERPWWYPFPVYGHPRGVRMSELIDVPWVEFERGRRDIISADTVINESNIDEDLVAERLQDLGYRS